MHLHRLSDLATQPVRLATTRRARFKKVCPGQASCSRTSLLMHENSAPVSISKGSSSLLNLTLTQGEASYLRPQLHELLWPSTPGGSPAARCCPVSRLASYLPTTRCPDWPHPEHPWLLRPGETSTAVLSDDSETTAARLRFACSASALCLSL